MIKKSKHYLLIIENFPQGTLILGGTLIWYTRVKRLQLPSLEYRCFRGDLIQTYKIAHNIYDKDSVSSLFHFNSSSRLRGHNLKINKVSTNKRLFQHFFTNRIVNEWNKLHEDIVNSSTVDTFKNNIDKNYQDIMYNLLLKMMRPHLKVFAMIFFMENAQMVYVKIN